jgi:hypothetical protein
MAEEPSVGMALLLEFQRPVNIEISYDDNGYQMHDMLGLVLLEVVHWPSAGKTSVYVGEKEAKFWNSLAQDSPPVVPANNQYKTMCNLE